MAARRPDPDELLLRVKEEERRARRGRLKVFFGAAPGVGKTYAMLKAVREEAASRDVVVGVLEHHGRKETAALLLGLEILPRRRVERQGMVLQEFDLDGALARRPSLLIVDELAHTNAEGSRHEKRWQDVEELLDAGIDVYTTMNVQHIESLNDVVAQITGIRVRETVPDAVFDRADDIELVDLTADELLERLREGKVYIPSRAEHALQNFFKKGNLIALRELALRTTAERVDEQVRRHRQAEGIEATWAVAERILVCVSPSPLSARLLRAARRMASPKHAQLLAVYIDTPVARLSPAARVQLELNLHLAEALGVETIRLVGASASEETLRFARARNVTRIIVGKPTHSRWRDLVQGSFLDELVRGSGDIDVLAISGEADRSRSTARPSSPALAQARSDGTPAPRYLAAAGVVSAFTVVARLALAYLELADITMIYLVGIILVSTRLGYGASFVAAVLSVLSFDFFCVPPYLTFAVGDFRHVVTFAVMFLVALVVAGLTNRVRQHAVAASEREQRTAALYAFSRELAAARGTSRLAAIAMHHVEGFLSAHAVVLLRKAEGELISPAGGAGRVELDAKELAVAAWVVERRQPAGLGTQTLPGAKGLHVPLLGSREPVGVLVVVPRSGAPFLQEQRALLDAFASQTALAIERAQLASEAQQARLRAEAEQTRNALLSSVSHDLRTPLAAITGAATTLLEAEDRDPGDRELLDTVREEAERLNHLVTNLLEVTRLESGTVAVNREWQPVEEVIGAALHRIEPALEGRPVTTQVPQDLPLVSIDAVLVEQALYNLLENAVKYSPPRTPITVAARPWEGAVRVEVSDEGPGIPAGEEERIFEKFHRASPTTGGSGLGLTIARAVVEAHGGRIWAENRPLRGALFVFTLPSKDSPPALPDDGEVPSPDASTSEGPP